MMLDGTSIGMLFDPATNHDLYQFDLIVWQLLHKLARQQPGLAVRQFQLTPKTVAHIAQADEAAVHKLASGVLLSFQMDISEHTLTTQLEQSSDLWEDPSSEECNAAYWLLLNRTATQDADLARVCFGLSGQMVQAIRQATGDQIRHLAHTVMPQFRLRCTEHVIVDCLSSHTNAAFERAFLQKMNQSLSNICLHTV